MTPVQACSLLLAQPQIGPLIKVSPASTEWAN
jgi:hypothetical protein